MSKRVKIFLLFGIVAVALCGFGSWALLRATGFVAASQLAESRYAKIESLGLPLDADKFAASFAVPDDENNAPELIRALADLQKAVNQLSPKLVAPKPSRQPLAWDESAWNTLNAQDKSLDSAYRLVLEQSKKPYFVINRDWAVPVFNLYPEFAQLKTACNIATRRALLLARAGKRDDARECLADALRLTAIAGDCPMNLAYLVQNSMFMIAMTTVANCIEVDPAGVDVYSQVVKAERRHPIGYYVRGELYDCISTIRNMRGVSDFISTTHEEVLPPAKKDIRRYGLPMHPALRVFCSRLMECYIPVMEQVKPDGSILNFPKFKSAMQSLVAFGQSDRPIDFLNRLFVPGDYNVLDVDKRVQNLKALVESCIKIVKFHNTTGAWPNSLDECGGGTTDVFSKNGESIRYRLSPTEFRLWSVGADGVDDGGITQGEWRGRKQSDPLNLRTGPRWDEVLKFQTK